MNVPVLFQFSFPALRGFFLAQRQCAKEIPPASRSLQRVAIVGAGKMGSGIAAVLARAG
jgi:hypothetical protein